jgi:4-hydroxybenzoyl-CoA thioesterase
VLRNTRTVRIEWGDCDPAGIVYFPRYFVLFDNCTAGMFEVIGLRKPQLLKKFDVVGFPLVDVQARFMIPSSFGEDVVIETTIAEWGRSSFKVQHRLLKEGDELAVEATETRVLVAADPARPGGIRSCPIPQELIERFERG